MVVAQKAIIIVASGNIALFSESVKGRFALILGSPFSFVRAGAFPRTALHFVNFY